MPTTPGRIARNGRAARAVAFRSRGAGSRSRGKAIGFGKDDGMSRSRALIAMTGLGSTLLFGGIGDTWAESSSWGGRRGRPPATAGLWLRSTATSPSWRGYGMPSPDPGVSSWNWPVYTCVNPMLCSYRAPSYYFSYASSPAVTARRGVTGRMGMHCSTSVKPCLLRNASFVGGGCSCKVTGGRVRGLVVP